MTLWQADELAAALGIERAVAVRGVSIDTRSLQPGDLFVALPGAGRDGHEFVAEAFIKGAAAALVSRAMPGQKPGRGPGEVLVVADTLAGLQGMAAYGRRRGRARVVAVTGSVGKTTTKEMLRRALAVYGHVHVAESSFNNHIGVPLTLARLPREADFAVLEIGMNHAGEIAPLARLAAPEVAVVTNVERSHIGLMGTIEAIAAEKAEIFSGLGPQGVAVLPADTPHYPRLAAAVRGRLLTFGRHAAADVRLVAAASAAARCEVQATAAGESLHFQLAAPGEHMAMNAVAALAACQALGLDVAKAAAGLAGFVPFAGRGVRQVIAVPGGEAVLLDESYNASGASMRAALQVLRLQPGRRVAALGDMLELGDDAEAEHLGLAAEVTAAADLVFTCGPMMGRLFAGLPAGLRGAHAADAAALAPLVRQALHAGDAVLVKGSYGSRMRDVVAVLRGDG